MNCTYHPIYRTCQTCGQDMQRSDQRVCPATFQQEGAHPARTQALREARALIKEHAVITWKSGLTERSDGIADVLVDFDLKFPEARE